MPQLHGRRGQLRPRRGTRLSRRPRRLGPSSIAACQIIPVQAPGFTEVAECADVDPAAATDLGDTLQFFALFLPVMVLCVVIEVTTVRGVSLPL